MYDFVHSSATLIFIRESSLLMHTRFFCFPPVGNSYTAFSLSKNIKSLMSMRRDPGDISTIHGIRFLNAFLLLLSHKSMAVFYMPFANRTEMIEVWLTFTPIKWQNPIFYLFLPLCFFVDSQLLGDQISVVGRAAAIYTDAFLLLSGLLSTYSIIGRLQRQQSPRILQEYVGRLLRIVPTFGALILFCTYILPIMGAGPQWNLVVTKHADICKETWWRNLLFIHNYFGFDKMVSRVIFGIWIGSTNW